MISKHTNFAMRFKSATLTKAMYQKLP